MVLNTLMSVKMSSLQLSVLLTLIVCSTSHQHMSTHITDILLRQNSNNTSLLQPDFIHLYESLACVGQEDHGKAEVTPEPEHNEVLELPEPSSITNITCLSPEDLYKRFELKSMINRNAVAEVLPEMLVNIKLCHKAALPEEVQSGGKPSTGEVWGYGIGFAVLIFIISNFGALLAPFMGVKLFDQILMFLVAMAVGTLAATALLVLIPEALNLIAYKELNEIYIAKMSTVCAALLFFFLSERMIKYLVRTRREKKSKDTELVIRAPDSADVPLTSEKNDVVAAKKEHGHGHSHGLESADGPPTVSTVAYMIVVGDGLHKFVDGLSVGAAFSSNLLTGMTVALAMICEEVAHEIGDIAILLHSGLSIKKALIYNSLAAVFCFVGVIVGIILGETTAANHWIFAIAAGIFLYVALVDMLPEMSEAAETAIDKDSSPIFITLFQSFGLLIGFFVILLVASYAGDIKI